MNEEMEELTIKLNELKAKKQNGGGGGTQAPVKGSDIELTNMSSSSSSSSSSQKGGGWLDFRFSSMTSQGQDTTL
jgi:hypothetical protein